MEKLGQLRAQDAWDLIIVDTPPSRSALDFLDAPSRLGSFLDGRLIRLLSAPAKAGGRAGMKFVNLGMAGLSMVTGVLGKLLGTGLLRDVQTFVAAMDTMFGGFRKRADATYQLLQAPGTAFVVVAVPERDALREAAYFVERLAADRMPLAGLVLNRVHGSAVSRLSAERAGAAAELLDERRRSAEESSAPAQDASTSELAAGLLRLHAERMRVLERERRTTDRFTAVHPKVPVAEVPALPGDVHDLTGLRAVGERLADQPSAGQPAAEAGTPSDS